MSVFKKMVESSFRVTFAAVQNHIGVFFLIFNQIAMGTAEKKVIPIKLSLFIISMGIKMLYMNALQGKDEDGMYAPFCEAILYVLRESC